MALDAENTELSVWCMRRKIGMSGGYNPDALKQLGAFRVYETPADRPRRIDEVGSR